MWSRGGPWAIVLVGCAQAGAPGEPAAGGRDGGVTIVDAPELEQPMTIDAAIEQPPPPPCTPFVGERLANPVFDLAPAGVGWVDGRDPRSNTLPNGPFPIISPNPTAAPTHSPPNKAWLGNFVGDSLNPRAASVVDQLHQDLTFPANATNFVVSGRILIATSESIFETTPWDTFRIDVIELDGTPIETVVTASNLDETGGSYASFSRTLTSNLAGRTVRLRLISTNDQSRITNFIVDTMSFKATACP